jgi:hypothetical protein
MSIRLLRVRVVVVTMVVATLGGARSSHAGDAALAEKLFQEGKALLEQGQRDQACAKFEGSMQAEPSGGAALAYARCRQLQGKTATAWAEYTRAATLFKQRGDATREAFARQQANSLAPTLSTLIIEAGAPSVEVRRDGVLIAPSAFGVAVPVDPGEHRIEAAAPGYEPWSDIVSVGPDGDRVTVQVPPLVALPEAQPLPQPGGTGVGLLVGGSVLAGLGVAAVLGGAVVGALVLKDASEAEDDPALCGNATLQCTPEGFEHVEAARDKALASNVLFGAGAIAVVAGAALVTVAFVANDGAEVGVAAVPTLHGAGAAIEIVGRFGR